MKIVSDGPAEDVTLTAIIITTMATRTIASFNFNWKLRLYWWSVLTKPRTRRLPDSDSLGLPRPAGASGVDLKFILQLSLPVAPAGLDWDSKLTRNAESESPQLCSLSIRITKPAGRASW